MRRFSAIKAFAFIAVFSVAVWIGAIWKKVHYTSKKSVNTAFSTTRHALLSAHRKSWRNSCKTQRNAVFLKTHKTGSTTIQNIILRHAKRNDLIVGLPRENAFFFKYAQGLKFKKSFVSPSQYQINILCHHMRFDREEVSSLMPLNTKYMTILREPSNVFASFFDYFHFNCRSFSMLPQNTFGLLLWLNKTETYFLGNDHKPFWWFAKNGMAFDLGLDNLREDDEYIKFAVDEIQQTFQLVLINEYFEESVILMKDFLCLNMSEVRHLRLNSRFDTEVKIPDQKTRDDIRKWNKLDAALYDHFNKTFWKKVIAYGKEKMTRDVESLKKLNLDLQNMCVDGGIVEHDQVENANYRVFKPKGVNTGGFNLKKEALVSPLCQEVAQTEKAWHKYLRKNLVT